MRDQIRTGRLIELGWDVIRFGFDQVRNDLDGYVERVCRWKNQVENGRRFLRTECSIYR